MLKKLRGLWASLYFRIGFGVFAGLLLLLLAIRAVDWQQTWDALLQAHPGYVILAIFSVALTIFLKSLRWQVLMGSQGDRVSFRIVLMSLMSAQTLNWFLPARVGDLSRVFVVGGMGPGRVFILGTIALEKVLDMLAYALLFVYLLLLIPLPGWVSSSGVTILALTGVLTLGVLLVAAYPQAIARFAERIIKRLPMRFQANLVGWIQSGLESLDVLRGSQNLLILAFLSACIWGCAVWTIQLTAQSLSLGIPWSASIAVLVLLQAGISLPSIPGRIGIFQYLCIIGLGFFGIEQSIGLSFGILLQAIVLIPPTLVSLPFFGMLGISDQKREILDAARVVEGTE